MNRGENRKPSVVLVFGEDDTDRTSLAELYRALRPGDPPPQPRRRPPVLMKDREAAAARKSALKIADIVRADQIRAEVVAVIAHQDCDAIEPAHKALSTTIERELAAAGVPWPIAATPAWEIEAWWLLWPVAVKAAFPTWREPDRYRGREVGRIVNVKEEFRRLVRPERGRGYSERDGPAIATKVRILGVVDAPQAISRSWDRFSGRVRARPATP